MLPRVQAAKLLEDGRTSATQLKRNYERHGALREAEDLAFRRGDLSGEEQHHAARTMLGREIHGEWKSLKSIAEQLEQQEHACLVELQRERAAQSTEAAPSVLPRRDRPEDIEAYFAYFEEVERSVAAVSEQLLDLRRGAVTALREKLAEELAALRSHGEALPAIETVLQEEVYLDLPSLQALQRLEEEREIVLDRLADCRRREAEQQRQQQRQEAQSALITLELAVRDPTSSSHLVADLLQSAVRLLTLGSLEERAEFWLVLTNCVARPGILEQIVVQVRSKLAVLVFAHVIHSFLAGGRDAQGLDQLPLEARDALDAMVLNLDFIALTADSVPSVSGIIALKSLLPRASFELLRANTARLTAEEAAAWFLAPPWSASEDQCAWLARSLEERACWTAAWAAWRTSGTSRQREACRAQLVALVEAGAVPADDNAWLLSVLSVDRDEGQGSDSAVMTAGLVLARRAGIALNHVNRTLLSTWRRTSDPELEQALEQCFADYPEPPSVAWQRHQAKAIELAAVRDRLLNLLDNPRSPAGEAWRELTRTQLVPRLRSRWDSHGFEALARLDPAAFFHETKQASRMAQWEINPPAHNQILHYLEEIREVATAGRDLEQALPPRSIDADQPRLLVEYLGRTAASHPDPYIRWTCSGLDRYFRGADDGSVDATFTVENLPTFLVRGNPVVALARDVAALGDADLLLGALHELFDPASLPRWGVELTLARGCFDLAPEYLRGLSPADLEELAPVVESTWRQRDHELDDQSKELSAMRATLEPTSEDLALAGELAAFAEARAARALDRARDHLEAARGHLGVLGESQRRRRESAANTLADVVREGVVRIVRTRGKEPADAAAFLSAVLARSGKLSVEELEELALLVQEHVEGRSLSADESARLQGFLAYIPAVDPGLARPAIARPRPAADLKRLPKLVQLEIEGFTVMAAAPRVLAPAEPDPAAEAEVRDLAALVERFVRERQRGGDWEEPLVDLLERRGGAAIDDGNFLRAADYFLAGACVAYAGASRLGQGLDLARRCAMNFALARLRRLRRSSGQDDDSHAAVALSSMRGWVDVIREFLLLNNAGDLVDLLGELMRMGPELVRELLELPLSELPPLQSIVEGRLLDRIELGREGDSPLLDFVSGWNLERGKVEAVQQILDGLRQAIGDLRDAKGDPQRTIEIETRLGAIVREAGERRLSDATAQSIQRAVRRLISAGPRVDSLEDVVLTIGTLTKKIYLSALEDDRVVPVHLRVSLQSAVAAVRDLSFKFRLDHPLLMVTPETQQVFATRTLTQGEQLELTCLLRVRPDVRLPANGQGCGEFTLEVRDVGVLRGGLLRLVEYSGAELRLTLEERYPHGQSRNPYSPGPALQDLAMIKGRADVVRKILGTLRGEHRDNVPLIWGARRIGKTTLLYAIKRDPEVRRFYVPILCDMEHLVKQSDSVHRFLARLASFILSDLRGTPPGRTPMPDILKAVDPLDAFHSFLEQLIANCGELALLLMFDEMDKFFAILQEHARHPDYGQHDKLLHGDIVGMWRHHMQHTDKLSFLLAGTRALRDLSGQLGERMFQMPVPIHLEELQASGAEDLIVHPTQKFFDITTVARRQITMLTGGHPYLTQAICMHIFNHVIDSRLSVCSQRELDEVLEDHVMTEPTFFAFQTDQLRSDPRDWRVVRAVAELTTDVRRADIPSVTSRIALGSDPLAEADVEAVLARLLRADVLMQWRGGYRFRYPLLGRFIAGPGRVP